ncbi:dipeptidyl aminopeptidase/acylaminoacyl peptidase [Thermocatellispora tengchongensis]|uniref:Dipeptidyl aminopeptidase/acylaminoacyl peptidase n=1 Tax=Thermocatellispora tengchongensis TaxID=1073253 RepID=A0A840NVS3_9ACTN|nr:PD40 domain-containing protein [Thermocatellispora tengchongensis]MBB5131322.1 dipeptidyl aminopeptidase/acylaminoacyl peptidase [Thermocatellispora tengchongensis]
MKHRTLTCLALATAAALAAAPSATAAAVAVPSAATAAPAPLTGAAVYATYTKGYKVARYQPGTGWRTLAAPSATGQFAASPDGKKVAWVTDGGRLVVRQGGKVTTVAQGLTAGVPCLTPVWSPDSRRLAYVVGGKAEKQVVTVVNADGTGERDAGSTTGVCHLAWSANGRYLAGFAGTTEGVYRLDLTTRRSVKVKGVTLANHVQGLSPDGRKVIVNLLGRDDPGGDGSWPTAFKPAIVDAVTGARQPIGVRGTLLGAFYLPDGRLVVRVAGASRNTLVVLSAAGKTLQRIPEPAAAKNQALLQVL